MVCFPFFIPLNLIEQSNKYVGHGKDDTMFDLGIVNGAVYLEGKLHQCNLYLQGGRIAQVSMDSHECRRAIDAGGRYVLPGFIDPHVHFALGVGSNVTKDDFYSGSREAVYGGVTAFIDFLDPVKAADSVRIEFNKRKALAEHSLIDYSFHGTVAGPSDPASRIIQECRQLGINSVKLFTTYSETDRRTGHGYICELLKETRETGTIITVHAENDELIDKSGDILIHDHEKARPVLSENTEIMTLAEMARTTGGRLYIVHVSAGSSVRMLAEQYRKELMSGQIILESCPHYFLLNSDYLAREDGYKFTMTPPVRPEEERLILNRYLDYITTIGTDHCPYTLEQKKHAYTRETPMGIGGLKYSFLNMYNEFGFSVVDRFTSGPAETFRLPCKGSLLPGYDADVVLFDKEGSTPVTEEESVYYGRTLKGHIETVIARGDIVLDHGEIRERRGNYIRRGDIG